MSAWLLCCACDKLNEKWKRLSYIVFSKFKTLVLLGNKDYNTATAKQFEITR